MGAVAADEVTAWSSRTVAVVVTYGDRGELAIASTEAALKAGVAGVVLVDNGSPPESRVRLRSYAAARSGDVTLVRRPENKGSAGGFSAGLETALLSSCDWILLLDDDNLVAPDTFQALGRHGSAANPAVQNTAYVLHRAADLAQARLLNGWAVSAAYQRPGSFIWFDIRNKVSRRRRIPPPTSSLIPVPSAPYGGLLASRAVLCRVGLPRADLVLYQDDTEFTERLSAAGVRLLLCPTPLITDLDGRPAPSVERQQHGIAQLLCTPLDMHPRVYYTVRNSVWLDVRRARGFGNRLFLCVNAVVYVSWLALHRLRGVGDPRTAAVIRTAILHGLRGRLGPGLRLPAG
jgi:GT2 family glycosyltransferase